MLYKRVKLIGKSRARRLWLSLATICALLAGSGVMASPAYAATVVKEHVCKVIGDDDPHNGSPYHQAVVCTDLLQYDATWAGAGQFSAGSRIEAICQTNTGITLPCAGIAADTEVAWSTSSPVTFPAWNGVCGHVLNHVYAACPSGRFYVTVPTSIPLPTGSCLPNVWAVSLWDGPSVQMTQIVLPSSNKPVLLGANYGSPHTSIGNC